MQLIYLKFRNVHKYLTFVFFANDCNSWKLHVWKLINSMALLLLSHQTTKVLLVESEFWDNLQKFTPV